MGTETNKDDSRNNPEYLAQLLKDKKQLQALPNVFIHLHTLLDEEVSRVRRNFSVFKKEGGRDALQLPDPMGPPVQLSEKLFVPVKEHPDFNFVGRILGPRGMTAKELEQYTGCKIMVRGKGSMRDKTKEELNRGKQNWEHLNEDLHVLITVEDSRNRGEIKLAKAVEEIKKLLVPAPEGEDDLKKRQLMELAILNGTYRNEPKITAHPAQFAQARFIPAHAQLTALPMRTATPAGAPIILAPRMPQQVTVSSASLMNGAPPPLVSPTGEHAGLVYNPYVGSIAQPLDPYSMATPTPSTILEYPTLEQTTAGGVPKMRRSLGDVRAHPYSRVTLS